MDLQMKFLRLELPWTPCKDKSFMLTLRSESRSKPSQVNVVAQDIGRVVLNLINNAVFNAVNEQKVTFPQSSELWESYKTDGQSGTRLVA